MAPTDCCIPAGRRRLYETRITRGERIPSTAFSAPWRRLEIVVPLVQDSLRPLTMAAALALSTEGLAVAVEASNSLNGPSPTLNCWYRTSVACVVVVVVRQPFLRLYVLFQFPLTLLGSMETTTACFP